MIERKVTDKFSIEAWETGRKEERGKILICLEDYLVGRVAERITIAQARQLALDLTDLANKAEKFSTRGFEGSDE